jgi:hypothetical protein
LSIEDILAIGLGVPGPISTRTGLIRNPSAMPGWEGFPIRAKLEELWACPVLVDNDADLGAIGEWAYGAGRGERYLTYIKVGSGVGAGLLLEGRIYRGQVGRAGEIGHVTVRENGPLCSCGNYGCLEALAGGGDCQESQGSGPGRRPPGKRGGQPGQYPQPRNGGHRWGCGSGRRSPPGTGPPECPGEKFAVCGPGCPDHFGGLGPAFHQYGGRCPGLECGPGPVDRTRLAAAAERGAARQAILTSGRRLIYRRVTITTWNATHTRVRPGLA